MAFRWIVASIFGAALLMASPGIAQERWEEEGRDPFRPPPAPIDAERPAGLAGWLVSEIRVRGVLVRGDVPRDGLAVLESPRGDGFVARPGDSLMDGIVSGVDREGVFFVLRSDPENELRIPLALPAEEGAPS